MDKLLRIFALLKGDKLVLLRIAPRNNGYFFVSSTDLPGFSIMLQPDDVKSATALSGALEGPLESYIEAECRAVNNHAKRIRMRGFYRPSDTEIVAGYCAA